MPKSFCGAHGQSSGVALQPRWERTFAAVSSWTQPKNVPVRPPWPELPCSLPPPAAVPEAKGLEGHAHATGPHPGPFGQPTVTSVRFEGLGAVRYSPALDLHVLVTFATVPDFFAERLGDV